jgi:putative sigma-54 modulation protein
LAELVETETIPRRQGAIMTVKVEISTHNLELSKRLEEYITKKASKLDRHLEALEEVRVDLAYEKTARDSDDRQVAQVTVRGKGILLRAEERTDDIFAAYDTALEKLNRQIERFKGRRYRGRGDGRSLAEATIEPSDAEPIDAGEVISRRKAFRLTPMDEVEAIEQMHLLSHDDFFVFLNSVTQQVNVLYRRRNGTLGLIETDVA